MLDEVDVILLRRDPTDPPGPVLRGIAAQRGVQLNVHRVVGEPRPDDPNRWATIARARNAGKRRGSAPWLLYLDDDVVLAPGCVARLVEGLKQRPAFAALAADYAGEMAKSLETWDGRAHITMGATLFRRDRLALLAFRWEPGRCECRCACDDLHAMGFGIGYLPGAEARHDRVAKRAAAARVEDAAAEPAVTPGRSKPLPGRVLAAFDRRHLHKFRGQFLQTLRRSGNREAVTVVGYGLHPSEQSALAAEPGVHVVFVPENNVSPARRRLHDFQTVIEGWPEATPVAYWDAGDVRFQAALAPLWDLVRADPDRILAVREPLGHPGNRVVVHWTETIADPESRRRAFALISTRPYLNAGFAAGTVAAFRRYLREADALLDSKALRGTRDWGDQTALNLYCHTRPDAWREIPNGWNYCLCQRSRREFRIGADGRIERRDGVPVEVVHGNARRLRHTELSFLG